jgi:hypothetical protein
LSEERIACGHNPTLAVSAEIFGGIKAEAPELAQATDLTSLILRAMCLSRVFDHGKSVAIGY